MKAKSELMKEKILNGVVELFIAHGIEKVKTRDLSEHLGLSRSHIYHYFSDWQSLCLEALDKFMRSELEEFRSIIEPLPATKQLQEFIDGNLSDIPDPARKLYGSLWLLSSHNNAYADMMLAILKEWDRVLTGIITAGIEQGTFRSVDAPRFARQLDAMLFGYSEHLFTLPSAELLQQAKEDVADFLQRNLLTV
ncbi:TetR/AcrR family transcriptional regulator [Pantoea alhagi]|uniref:TetR/AcrR family transcriptional regulator n=1 Tax=Pantoea alhagi TaxID=1891675 RepID=UPI00202B0F4E|nr:TetR/AcrR family transcriptional regulator [Pantoea alhagi]URQ62477.1 TetR/AcrR family transcriptional regulator [Pantoea alhagi]